ncbi:MAG: type III-B CRISPR module RAMP protein Cmr1 [Candidatus Jordarchaeales archaeon]|nr:type III-B CRISPR module RAMP protein Cmr1 [Candidatus Jordarchaeia archaeon]
MRHLATIKIKSLTPSAIGGYNPNIHDNIFRVTSLRGLAAWWLRAIVSGVAYDEGDINHDKKATEAQKIIFGATNKSSLLVIRTKLENVKNVNTIGTSLTGSGENRLSIKHIRLRLLLMGVQDKINTLKDMLKNFDATICVYSSAKKTNLKEVLGLYAIIISLLLGGLGKGSRRAMGAVKLSSVELSQKVKEFLQKEGCRGLLQISQKVDENTLKMIVDDARKIAEKMLKEGVLEDIQTGELSSFPKIPSLSKKAAEIYVKKLEELRNMSCEKRLVTLNAKILEELFLRSPNLKRLPNILQNTKPSQKIVKQRVVKVSEATALGSYILGLPREARNPPEKHRYRVVFNTTTTSRKKASQANVPQEPRKQYSGFVKFNDKDKEYEHYRRPSPVIVSLLDEQTVVITLLKSSDWPEELQWFTTKEKEVEARGINDAYSLVSSYLSSNYQKIWP